MQDLRGRVNAVLMSDIGGKLNAAEKENDFVYHDKVPAAESLPEVKGAVLVKGIPFDPCDPEVAIFYFTL